MSKKRYYKIHKDKKKNRKYIHLSGGIKLYL